MCVMTHTYWNTLPPPSEMVYENKKYRVGENEALMILEGTTEALMILDVRGGGWGREGSCP